MALSESAWKKGRFLKMQQLKSKVKNVFHVHNHGPQSHSHLVAFRKHSPWLRAGLVETPSVTLSSQVRGLKVRE